MRVSVSSRLTNWDRRLWFAHCPGCGWLSLAYLSHPAAIETGHAHAVSCRRLTRRTREEQQP